MCCHGEDGGQCDHRGRLPGTMFRVEAGGSEGGRGLHGQGLYGSPGFVVVRLKVPHALHPPRPLAPKAEGTRKEVGAKLPEALGHRVRGPAGGLQAPNLVHDHRALVSAIS